MANPQAGFQVVLDAADLGVPAVLVGGTLDEALRRYPPSPTSERQASWSQSARSAIAS